MSDHNLLEIFNDWWVLIWFIGGIVFFIIAVIAAFNEEEWKALGCIAMCNACHARCEIKILQHKI